MPTIVDVIVEVDPDSVELLRKLIWDVTYPNGVKSYPRFENIPHLHFMSMQIFEDERYDPLLIFENNFDGSPETYWPGVLNEMSDELRAIFACTKDAKEPKWRQFFENGNTGSLIPFLKEFSVRPSAQHFGAVAYSLPRILRDRQVYLDVQSELGTNCSTYRKLDAAGVQAALHKWAVEKYDWMRDPEKPTTSQANRAYRWSTRIAIAPWILLLLIVIAGLHRYGGFPWTILAPKALIGVAIAFVLVALAAYIKLRRLEDSDYSQDKPPLTLDQLKLFAGAEDQITQNHLASMVLVKPGMLRAFLIRNALRLLHFIVPINNWNGYLGEMRSIHFAHWTLVRNTGRLLFLSNFDGSWESYLNDFVDKAARGLTLAWGNCVGFPKTQNLVCQGAARGTQFKAWARASQTPNILWYSAYTNLTVNQVIRNGDIVDGLRKESMQRREAEQWARLL